MRSPKTGGLLTQVHYSEKCTFGGLKGLSLNTGGLKDKFECINIGIYYYTSIDVQSTLYYNDYCDTLFTHYTAKVTDGLTYIIMLKRKGF